MDPELMTIFQNINALVEQAKQMIAGGAETIEAGMDEGDEDVSPDMAEKIMKYLKGMDGDEDDALEESAEVEKADQAQLSTPDEGSTASDDAEEVVGDAGEVNEENINDVAKTIAKMLAKKSVKKSEDKGVHKALELMVAEQNQLRKSVENILSGLGIADEIKKLNDVQKSQPQNTPQNDNSEIQKSLDFIKQELGVKDNKPSANDGTSIHKSISESLASMVQK